MATRTAPDFTGLGKGGPRLEARVGSTLELLVLADRPGQLIGVELATGALVRAWYDRRSREEKLVPLSVARVVTSGNYEIVPDPTEPEALVLAGAPRAIGSFNPKRADKLIRALLHPLGQPLLGCHANTVRFFERNPDFPSAAIVETPGQVLVLREEGYLCCRFSWDGGVRELFCADSAVAAMMDARGLSEMAMERRTRLVMAFGKPSGGRCTKQVDAILPRI